MSNHVVFSAVYMAAAWALLMWVRKRDELPTLGVSIVAGALFLGSAIILCWG